MNGLYFGRNVDGGTYPADIWAAYMKPAVGKFCGAFPLPKEPFVSQPFMGHYSTTGRPKLPEDDQTQQPGAAPTATVTPGADDTGGTTGDDQQGFDPNKYETPPQPTPQTDTGGTTAPPAATPQPGATPNDRGPPPLGLPASVGCAAPGSAGTTCPSGRSGRHGGMREGSAGSTPHACVTEGSAGMATGVVKWFSDEKGFGFITPDDGGKDAFVHFTGIAGDGFRTLSEGAKVEYELGESQKGPQATNVRSSEIWRRKRRSNSKARSSRRSRTPCSGCNSTTATRSWATWPARCGASASASSRATG